MLVCQAVARRFEAKANTRVFLKLLVEALLCSAVMSVFGNFPGLPEVPSLGGGASLTKADAMRHGGGLVHGASDPLTRP
jgi:hypothetical protein